MLQTWWDTNQQAIRKLIDIGVGALVSYGIVDQAGGAVIAGLIVAAINFGWWMLANRKMATVKGLEAAGASAAAVAVEMAEKAVKRKS